METVTGSGNAAAAESVRQLIPEELERILSSEYFRNSRQAERLLRYLVENSLEDRDELLRERAIGEKVFGRQPKYDSNSDSIVRVWANHLRKRLAQYYQAEGQKAPLRFDMRPGSYRVEFQLVTREPEPVAPVLDLPKQQNEPIPVTHVPLVPVVSGVTLALLAVFCVWLLVNNRELRHQLPAHKATTSLDLLWPRLLAGPSPADLVLGDSDQTAHTAGAAPIRILQKVLLLAGPGGHPPEIQFASDYSPYKLQQKSAILIALPQAYPWLEPVQARMNFRLASSQTGAPDGAIDSIVNVHPRPGEEATYRNPPPSEPHHSSYGLLAFQPNLGRTGSLLIVAGLDAAGSFAAAEIATRADRLAGLLARTGSSKSGELPYFEAVVRTTPAQPSAVVAIRTE